MAKAKKKDCGGRCHHRTTRKGLKLDIDGLIGDYVEQLRHNRRGEYDGGTLTQRELK